MKKLLLIVVSAVIGCGVVIAMSMPLYAQMKGAPVPFSAEWTHYSDGESIDGGKYYASSEGVRLEGIAGGEPFIVIYNFKRMVAWNLIESERMYMEIPLDPNQPELDDIGQFGAPCSPEAQANRVGSDTLGGRKTEKWTCSIPGEETMTVWYDSRLQTPIRSESEEEDDYFEFKNIKEGPQPASLFVPPTGYTKIEIPSR